MPEARIVIGHGQMHEHELEEAMVKFVRREADILVATTIIESGLDIPNANTIFINQADNYGLADLHQLRGRVGRYKHRAYAYLLLDSDRAITPNAARRLKAIEEFTELGAGFKIAMRDLEIRGAGNILGTQQSGHIAAVGYELYCQLLENAVRQLKNQPLKTPLEVTIDLPWPAFLPRDYVAGPAAEDRGLSPAGPHSPAGAAGGFSPGAARSLRRRSRSGRMAAAPGGAAAAGGQMADCRPPPGKIADWADRRRPWLPQSAQDGEAGGAERRAHSRCRFRDGLLPAFGHGG